MERYKGNEKFGPSHYDYDFDFDFDLRFSGFDYLIVAFSALFVMPPAHIMSNDCSFPFSHMY